MNVYLCVYMHRNVFLFSSSRSFVNQSKLGIFKSINESMNQSCLFNIRTLYQPKPNLNYSNNVCQQLDKPIYSLS